MEKVFLFSKRALLILRMIFYKVLGPKSTLKATEDQ